LVQHLDQVSDPVARRLFEAHIDAIADGRRGLCDGFLERRQPRQGRGDGLPGVGFLGGRGWTPAHPQFAVYIAFDDLGHAGVGQGADLGKRFAAVFIDLAAFGEGFQFLSQGAAILPLQPELFGKVSDIDFARGLQHLQQRLVVGQAVGLTGLFSLGCLHST